MLGQMQSNALHHSINSRVMSTTYICIEGGGGGEENERDVLDIMDDNKMK